MPNPMSEADLIEAAYGDQVRVLFQNLFAGLEDGGSNPSSGVEQQCLQHFNLGLRLPEFWGEVQPPASLKGLDIPSRRAVFVPWKPSRRPVFGMGNPTFR